MSNKLYESITMYGLDLDHNLDTWDAKNDETLGEIWTLADYLLKCFYACVE